MSVNKVILVGNLGKDPEVRYISETKTVAQFTLATNETYIDKNGERKVETEWHNIEMWDGLARSVEKLKNSGALRKGSQVYVEGKIKSETYKDKEGNERQGKKIRVSTMSLLGSGNRSQEQTPGNTPAGTQGNDYSPSSADISPNGGGMDDLPF